MGSIRASSSPVHRTVRLLLGGLFVAGLLLGLTVSRGEALVGASTSGYAYARAATPTAGETATIINASASRDAAGGTSPVKVLVLVTIGLAVVGGALFEGVYVRRRGLDR